MCAKSSGLKIKTENGVSYVFDIVRRKYLVLTPEEKVRQLFLHFLVHTLKFSKNLIRTEQGTAYNQLKKRTDLVVYDTHGKPFLLVECKAAEVKLTEEVIAQASRYNLVLRAPYLCITNGLQTYCFQIDFENNRTEQLTSLPLPPV